MKDINVEQIDTWHAKFKATRGYNQAFGDSAEEAEQNLINVETNV